MKFFEATIGVERRFEIYKQELALADDFCIYSTFKSFAGPGRQFLALCDLYHILVEHFKMKLNYTELCIAILRQGGCSQMRYIDFLQVFKPKNHDFSELVNRKLRELTNVGYEYDKPFGMSVGT